MSNPLPFCTVISSEGIGVRGTHPNSKWRVAVPRCDMDKPNTGQVVRANIGRVVAAADKRKRKAAKRRP
jgi:hypothetical protein